MIWDFRKFSWHQSLKFIKYAEKYTDLHKFQDNTNVFYEKDLLSSKYFYFLVGL